MSSRSFVAVALALALPFGISIATAFAQSPAPATPATAPVVDVRAACKIDMDKLCPNVERGDARRACVEANRDKFSDGCKAARNAARDAGQDRREAFRAACADDVAKLCAGAEKGKGRTVECIKTNVDKVSPACKAELANLPATTAAAPASAGIPDAVKKQ